jgi:hypothetical protein
VGILHEAWCSLFGLLDVSHAGLEPAPGALEPSYLLSVMGHGEALYELGIQGAEILIVLGAFFSAKCDFSVSTSLFIYGAHALSAWGF